jgi:hypothetical protein
MVANGWSRDRRAGIVAHHTMIVAWPRVAHRSARSSAGYSLDELPDMSARSVLYRFSRV